MTGLRINALVFVLVSSLAAVGTGAATTASTKRPTASAKSTAAAKHSPAGSRNTHAAARKPVPHRVAARSRLAPADEYFGRLKMSILGVRNKVKDLGVQFDDHPSQSQSVLSTAVFVEDAMRDWARKYPYDYWLPRYAWALENVYEEIPGSTAHARAIKQLNYIIAYFPASQYAKIGRYKEIQGIPTPDPSATPPADDALNRLGMLDGKVKPTFPPSPTPVPTPSASDMSPAPDATPHVNETPAPSEATTAPAQSPSPR